jgi:hypothetical protein
MCIYIYISVIFFYKQSASKGSLKSLLFWDVTQRRLVVIIDVSGQPISPIFKGKADQE